MNHTKIVTIEINEELTLEITGEYHKGQNATYTFPIESSVDNIADEFIAENIKIIKGTLWEYTLFLNNLYASEIDKIIKKNQKGEKIGYFPANIWNVLEEKCLKEINKEL